MKAKPQLFVASIIATLVGWYVFPYLLTFGTLYASRWFPVPQLLIATGLQGPAFYQAMHVYDFALWVALAIPTAIILTRLKPRHLIWYTALATIPYFAWVIPALEKPIFVIQYAVSLLFAPAVAVAMVVFIERRVRPNNSFKPTPLRGAA